MSSINFALFKAIPIIGGVKIFGELIAANVISVILRIDPLASATTISRGLGLRGGRRQGARAFGTQRNRSGDGEDAEHFAQRLKTQHFAGNGLY